MKPDAIPELIAERVDLGMARYRVYHSLMKGALAEIIPTASFDQRLRTQLAADLSRILKSGAEGERERIQETSRELLIAAELPIDDDSFRYSIDATVDGLTTRLRTDARSTLDLFRKITLHAHLASQRTTTFPQELFRRAYVELGEGFEFKQQDRRGRSYGAEVFWRNTLRSHYFNLVNETSMMQLAESGEQVGQIHAPGHDYHEWRFSLIEPLDGVKSFADISAKVFHPNSDALVVRAA